ncbi:hypothetical protein GCM10027275_39220 [Rhabdobacter roseus]
MFCLALTAGGILVLFRRRAYQQYPAFRYFQYYLILIYTFGFYALWSQRWFRTLFLTSDRYDTLAPAADFLVVISAPFLLAGKLMFILWAVQLLDAPRRRVFVYPVLTSTLLLALLLYGAWAPGQLPQSTYPWYAGLVLVVIVFVGSLLGFAKLRYFTGAAKAKLVGLVVGLGGLHVPLLFIVAEQPTYELAFLFLYFLGQTALGICFVYAAKLPPLPQVPLAGTWSEPATFAFFVQKYGITAREAEVVREICAGKTNQQIADHLFVTVQTIKDHTHRIYQKTNVKSRTQLASMLRDFSK